MIEYYIYVIKLQAIAIFVFQNDLTLAISYGTAKLMSTYVSVYFLYIYMCVCVCVYIYIYKYMYII